ncbi:MAG: hypothetical protein IBJ17_14520, partial [Reyranella sp.]|nr:hypothetical protein [Reyranella sp.]
MAAWALASAAARSLITHQPAPAAIVHPGVVVRVDAVQVAARQHVVDLHLDDFPFALVGEHEARALDHPHPFA